MTDQATETEKALMKGNQARLPGIKQRQEGAATRDYLFTIVVVVGVLVVGVFAYLAISYL
ncbi:MAG: hypothetical protein NT062_28540 [Proteobacteria bacterium]|nr:hypothetical protein [Pseudomonadota bacterium]